MAGRFDYGRSEGTAQRLLDRFGQDGAVRRPGTATGDPWRPQRGQPVDEPCVLVQTAFTAREIDGTKIRANDLKVLVSTAKLSGAPTQDDKIVIGGVPYEIVNVTPVSPGGRVLLWTVQAR